MRVLAFFALFLSTLYANHALEPISLQLTWLHQFQSAGFYVAKEKGFYADHNLDLTIKEYHNGVNVVDDVLKGASVYGIGRSSLIIDRSKKKPVVALMALFQHSPSVLISTNPTIKTPKDLFQRSIMMTSDESSSVAIFSMLLSHGVNKNDLFLQNHSFNIEDLIQHNTDAMACYISNEPFRLSKRLIPHTIFNPQEYGFDFYGDILFTSEEELKTHPERAKNFYTATKRGWEWAFDNIEETAKLIYEKYNTQNKSLEELIYEGKTLKTLAFDEDKPFGVLEEKKFEEIGAFYKISGLLNNGLNLKGFIDPLHFGKDIIRIGVLSTREGNNVLPKSWQESADYLTSIFPLHQFVILALSFEEMQEKVKKNELEFIITNPLFAVQLEHAHGISRIATMSIRYKDHYFSEYGSVIFTKASSRIKNYFDIRGKKIGAVSQRSLGGYLLGIKELNDPTIRKHMTFLGSHDTVVKAILDEKIDVGIIRTGVLEKMQEEGLLKLSDFKILGAKTYIDFPFAISTELYPEWVLAKAPHTSEFLTNEVLSTLLKLSTSAKNPHIFRLKTPLDYSKVHALLKEFNIYPYEQDPLSFKEVLVYYKYLFLGLFITFTISLIFIAYIQRLNKKLRQNTEEIYQFNATLEHEVQERTHELSLLNSKLKELANTDELTKIDNRRHFFLMATQYFHTSKRNAMELHMLSLDIDFFKHVNDTYGHAMGDDVLKFFCKAIKELIRQSDLFGRIGGEEFCICVQNATLEGAITLAEKIRERIQNSTKEGNAFGIPFITVSIGISSLLPDDTEIFDVIKRSDEALYRAKRNGRNQVQVILQ